ncbi:MAG: pilus assembly protein TadG-related protein [Candidatus Omnitrophota bacterium]|jgi:hypothetical protein
MFFSWYLENRYFKQGSDLKGQITPLLLLVLVILLIAAVTTVNVGRISLDKTCSANGADAGSLAAASSWAGAFNGLALMNEQLQMYYDMNYYTYGQLYFTANDYINEAIIYALLSGALAVAATVAFYSFAPACCTIWYAMLIGSILDGLAAWAMFEAAMAVSAFNLVAQYMLSLTDSFHDAQLEAYCSAIDSMQESYQASNKVGFSFVFSNSCIASKLNDSQADVYQAWMSADGPYSDKNYSWKDKINQNHSVSATLNLPNISSYTLQHTVGTYSQITGLLEDLISRSQIIAAVMNSTAVVLTTVAAFAMVAFISSLVAALCCPACLSIVGSAFCCPVMVAGCWLAYYSYVWGGLEHAVAIGILVALVAVGGAISVYLLKDKNDEAFEKWGPNGNQSSVSCGDASDLLIVKIASVVLPSWNANCCVTQRHPGTSAGIVSTSYPSIVSCSTSKFSGGDVGSFDNSYDPSMVGAN